VIDRGSSKAAEAQAAECNRFRLLIIAVSRHFNLREPSQNSNCATRSSGGHGKGWVRKYYHLVAEISAERPFS
jgi:hypothetical protein